MQFFPVKKCPFLHCRLCVIDFVMRSAQPPSKEALSSFANRISKQQTVAVSVHLQTAPKSRPMPLTVSKNVETDKFHSAVRTLSGTLSFIVTTVIIQRCSTVYRAKFTTSGPYSYSCSFFANVCTLRRYCALCPATFACEINVLCDPIKRQGITKRRTATKDLPITAYSTQHAVTAQNRRRLYLHSSYATPEPPKHRV